MSWSILGGCVAGVWVVLAILSRERESRLARIHIDAKNQAPDDEMPPLN